MERVTDTGSIGGFKGLTMALDIIVQLLIESNGGVKQWNDGVRFLPRERKKSSSVEEQKRE